VEAANSEPKAKSNTKSRNWPWVLLFLLAVTLLFLAVLPELLRVAAMHWGPQQPQIQSLTIDDVDLNLFSGEAAIKGLTLSGNGSEQLKLKELYLDVAMTALFSKRIEVEAVRLEGVDLDLRQDDKQVVAVAGISIPQGGEAAPEETQQSEAFDWGIGLQSLAIRDVALKVHTPDISSTITLRQLDLGAANSWTPTYPTDLGLNILIDQTPLDVAGSIAPFASAPELTLNIELDTLPLTPFAKIAVAQGVENLAGTVSAKLALSAAVPGAINVSGELNLSDVALRQGDHDIKLDKFHWQGAVQQLAQPESEQDLGLRIQDGQLALHGIKIRDHKQNAGLLSLAELNAEPITLAAQQQATVDTISVNKLSVLGDAPQSLAAIDTITLSKLDYDGQTTVAMDQIAVKALAVDARLKADGQLAGLEPLTGGKQEVPVEAPAEPQTAQQSEQPSDQAWRVKLKRFTIGEGSHVSFVDESVNPTYRADLTKLAIALSDIDTGAPEQDIGFTLSTQINELATLSTEAKLRPFGERINLEASGKLDDLDMPPLSPYAVKAMGYFIKRGQADATFTATVKDDQLDSKIKLKLNKFNIEAGDPEKVKSMNETLSMPLDLALDILRDKNDNIEMELKIDGDIKDPQFDAGKVINKAIGNATKYAAFYVLKQSLQPWGTIFTVFSFLGEKITTPRFEPVVFAPGSDELTDEHHQYMEKMATMLTERPELDLNICAQTSEQDRIALTPAPEAGTETAPAKPAEAKSAEQDSPEAEPLVSNQTLLDLAKRRMATVKQLLMDDGVDKGRLFTCQPSVNDAEEAKPTVELFL